MEKEMSLWEWLELKQTKSINAILRFKPLTNNIDKLFCDLHTKFENDKWSLRFNEHIVNGKTDNEIVLLQEELYNNYRLILENTIVKIPLES